MTVFISYNPFRYIRLSKNRIKFILHVLEVLVDQRNLDLYLFRDLLSTRADVTVLRKKVLRLLPVLFFLLT